MVFLYSVTISALRLLYRLAATINTKAAQFVIGRKEQKDALTATFPLKENAQLVWVHCASVGEFEQGRPVIEALKAWRSELKVLLTFFSPSGYNLRKNYEHADYVFYLPWDTPKNAAWFARQVKPSLAIFVKYEFWYHYAVALRSASVPLISISAIFRNDQIFFRPGGGLFRKLLKQFDHFFVQNDLSVRLLHSIGIDAVTRAGDTRFDRVHQIMQQSAVLPLVEKFCAHKPVMVIGSAWPQDMDVLYPFINEHKNDMRFIIAPHELNGAFMHDIVRSVQATVVQYSSATEDSVLHAEVLLVDSVGLLSALYRYGRYAFVGGAYSQGLHNILEAASYGIPVFFGDRAYQKYAEAVELIMRGGAFEVRDYTDLQRKFDTLHHDPEQYQLACAISRQYTEENLGATQIIVAYCKKILDGWKAS